MRRRRLISLLVLGCLVLCSAQPTWGYYDDVHYALTFYIARQMGFTTWQALRIASGCVSVDYDSDSEPVQMEAFFFALEKRLIRKATEGGSPYELNLDEVLSDPDFLAASEPQWQFHAFRDLKRFPGTALQKSAVDADNAIKAQQIALWNEAIPQKNPGVFLHFFQDENPHHSFGTVGGHWVLPPHAFLPMGSTVDWLSYNKATNRQLVDDTANQLRQFLEVVANNPADPPEGRARQQLQPLDLNKIQPVLDALNQANPAPAGISTWQRVAVLKAGLALSGLLAFQGAPLGIATEEEQRNLAGPDLGKAVAVLNEALRSEGLLQGEIGIPATPVIYKMLTNLEGYQAKFSSADATVIVGRLLLHVSSPNPGQGSGAQGASSVEVHLFSVPAGPGESEYELISATKNLPGSFADFNFTAMPIGLVKANVLFKYPDGSTRQISKTVMLSKESNEIDLGSPDLEENN